MPVLKELFKKAIELDSKSQKVKKGAKKLIEHNLALPTVPESVKTSVEDCINHADHSKPKSKKKRAAPPKSTSTPVSKKNKKAAPKSNQPPKNAKVNKGKSKKGKRKGEDFTREQLLEMLAAIDGSDVDDDESEVESDEDVPLSALKNLKK